jgi:heme-degrading monooxygenase HmoA
MIARLWRGQATPRKADVYQDHFEHAVCPALAEIAGNRGAWLLRCEVDGRVEFLAVTLWDSVDSIRAFAGDDVEAAHVEPEGRAALETFDDFAQHYEVVLRTHRDTA